MSTIYSTALLNYIAGTGSLYAAMNNLDVAIYSGPVPAACEDAITGSNTLLVTINNGGTAGTLNATPTNGVLQKTSSENWTGTIAATGTATFFRAYIPGSGDTGATADSSLTYHRIQGAVGTDVTSEMVLPSTALVSGNAQQINLFQLD
jgi:hypothetical protein